MHDRLAEVNWQMGTIADWVVAVGTILAFVGAGIAAHWAKQAATHTEAQAKAAKEQSRLAAEQLIDSHNAFKSEREEAAAQLGIATEQAEAERQNTQRAIRSAAEARIDATVPVVYAQLFAGQAKNSSGYPAIQVATEERSLGAPEADKADHRTWQWQSVGAEPMEVRDGTWFWVLQQVSISFVNLSDQPARIAIIHTPGGEFSGYAPGDEILVPPASIKPSVDLVWERRLSEVNLRAERDVILANLFEMEFWVRDLAYQMRDEFKFLYGMPYLSRNGDRLVVAPPPSSWPDIVAARTKRVYEQLDLQGTLDAQLPPIETSITGVVTNPQSADDVG